jgi:capsular polysaccharide transport system ATP-binding protein
MIELRNVGKTQRVGGALTPVLADVTFDVGDDARLVILGKCDVARTALLNLMAGIDTPDAGEVARNGRVSFPIGRNLAVDPACSGAEICRYYADLYGLPPARVEAYCYDASELGAQFFQPFASYTPDRRARLKMALVLALDFSIHLVEEGIPRGKRAARPELERLLEQRLAQTAVVLFTGNPANPFIRRFCDAATVVAHGGIVQFDKMQHAKAYFRNGS